MAKLIATVDDDVKEQAATLYESMGLSLSTAVNVFLHQSVREQGIPFTVSARADARDRSKADNVMNELNRLSSMVPPGTPLADMSRDDMRREYEEREL